MHFAKLTIFELLMYFEPNMQACVLQHSVIAMHFAKHTKYASEQICKLMYFEPYPLT